MVVRTLLVCVALSLLALPAAAQPTRQGISLGAVGGYELFHQGGGAPPLCCGERDEWSAGGPSFALRGGYGLTEWLHPAVELGLARRTGTTSDNGRELDVEMTATTATLALYFYVGGERLAFVPGVHLRTGRERTDFHEVTSSGSVDKSVDRTLSAPGISLGADYLVSDAIGVGAFIDASYVALSQTTTAFALQVTWFGVDRP